MVVDEAAGLEFGDLDEPDPHQLGSCLRVSPVRRASWRRMVMVNRRHSSGARALNRTCRGVVVAVRRTAAGPAAGRRRGGSRPQEMSRPCGQRRACASRRGRQGSSCPRRPVRRVCTGPKPGAVRVANTHGCAATDVGDALAAGQAGADQLVGVAVVDRGAGRADRARGGCRTAVSSTRPGSVSVSRAGRVSPGGAVGGVDPALQPDRAGAVAGGGQLGFPAG